MFLWRSSSNLCYAISTKSLVGRWPHENCLLCWPSQATWLRPSDDLFALQWGPVQCLALSAGAQVIWAIHGDSSAITKCSWRWELIATKSINFGPDLMKTHCVLSPLSLLSMCVCLYVAVMSATERAVCCSGVGNNPIQSSQCMLRVHKKCSGITERLVTDPNYACRKCNGEAQPIDGKTVTEVDVDGIMPDVEPTFCYLGDMLCPSGSWDSAIAAGCCVAWRKFLPV